MGDEPRGGMRGRFFISISAAFVLAVAAAVFLTLSGPVETALCRAFEERISAIANGQVTIGECRISPLSMRAGLVGVGFESEAIGVRAEAEKVEVSFRPPLRFGEPMVRRVEIQRPTVVLCLEDAVLAQERDAEPVSIKSVADSLRGVGGVRVVDGAVSILLGEERGMHAHGFGLKTSWRRDRLAIDASLRELRIEPDKGMIARDVEMEAELNPVEEAIAIQGLSATSEDLALNLRGRVSGDMSTDAVVEGSVAMEGCFDRLTELLGLPPEEGPVAGRVWLSAELGGTVKAPEVTAKVELLEGSIGNFTLGDLEVEAGVDSRHLDLKRIKMSVLGGPLNISGRVELAEGLPATLEAEGSELSLARLVTALGSPVSWVDFSMSPRARLEGTLHPLLLRGEVETPVDDFILLERCTLKGPPSPGEPLLDFPSMAIDGKVEFDAEEIRLFGAKVTQGESALLTEGRFALDPHEGMDLSVDIRGLAPAPLGRIFDVVYGGLLFGDLRLVGPYENLRIFGDLRTRGFSVEGLKAGDATGRFIYEDLVISLEGMEGGLGQSEYTLDHFAVELADPEGPSMDLRVSTERAFLDDVVEMLLDFDELAHELVGARGEARGEVAVSGPLERLGLTLNVTARDGVLLGQDFDHIRFQGRMPGMERIDLDELIVSLGEQGELVARGWAVIEGPLSLSLSARELPASRLIGLQDLPLAGLISGDLVLEGTWEEPEAKGAAVMLEGRVRDAPIPPSRLHMRISEGRFHVGGHLIEDIVEGSAWVELDGDHAYRLDLVVREHDLLAWLPAGGETAFSEEMRAEVQGSATIEGRGGDLRSIGGKLSLDLLSAKLGPLSFRSRGPLEVEAAEGLLSFDELVIEGAESVLRLSGSVSTLGDLDLLLLGDVGLEILELVVPAVSQGSGRLTFEAGLRGEIGSLELVGSGLVDSGGVALEGAPLSVTNLTGPFSFSRNRLILEGLAGTAGAGRLFARGEVTLERLLPSELDLDVGLDDVHVHVFEDLDVTVAGRLSLIGPLDGLTLFGDLEVLSGRWSGEVEIDQMLPSIRRRTEESMPSVERDPVLDLDITVTAPATLRVDSSFASGRLAADLRIIGTDAAPGLVGTVSVVEGTARFRGNDYAVTRGVLELQDPTRYEHPSFDVVAETEIREYRLVVQAYGTTSEPMVSITSEPPLPETDLFALATLGITTHDTDALGDTLAAAAAADALFTMSGLDRHVREFIPDNPIVRDPSVRLTSGYSAVTGQITPRFAFESSILVDHLRLRYSAPIGLSGQKTQAEYRITDMLSAQAEWETEGRRTTALGNLGMDLKLRWEMD